MSKQQREQGIKLIIPRLIGGGIYEVTNETPFVPFGGMLNGSDGCELSVYADIACTRRLYHIEQIARLVNGRWMGFSFDARFQKRYYVMSQTEGVIDFDNVAILEFYEKED